jgi:hypothetical protein
VRGGGDIGSCGRVGGGGGVGDGRSEDAGHAGKASTPFLHAVIVMVTVEMTAGGQTGQTMVAAIAISVSVILC